MEADTSKLDDISIGVMIDFLAGGDVTKYDDVLLCSMNYCYIRKKVAHEQSEYQKRLSKIIRRDAKNRNKK